MVRTCIYYYYFDHILVRISNVSKCTTIFTICCVSVAGGTKPTFGLRVKKKKKKSTFYLLRTQTTTITHICCNNHSTNINAYGGKQDSSLQEWDYNHVKKNC